MKINGFLMNFDEMSALYRFMKKYKKDIPNELVELFGRLSKENSRWKYER